MNTPVIKKDNNFILIRMLCCMVIIYEHIVVLSGWQFFSLNIRLFMVRVFFCLSGFWILLSFLRSDSTKVFWMRRIRRIVPQYWLVIVLQVLMGALLNKGLVYWKEIRVWKYMVYNLLFLNFLCPTLPGVFENNIYGAEVNGALWTMKIEVAFYILLPALMFILTKLRNEKHLNLVLIMLYIMSCCFYSFFSINSQLPLAHKMTDRFLAYMAFFISGMLYLINYDFFRKNERWFLIPSLIVVVEQVLVRDPVIYFMLPIAIMVVVAFFALGLASSLPIPDLSYSLYLVHFPVIQLLCSLGVMDRMSVLPVVIALIGITTVAVIIKKVGELI